MIASKRSEELNIEIENLAEQMALDIENEKEDTLEYE